MFPRTFSACYAYSLRKAKALTIIIVYSIFYAVGRYLHTLPLPTIISIGVLVSLICNCSTWMQDEVDKVKTTVVKPIVYGNISRYFGKKREEDGRTHLWTAFLRPFDPNEDMSTYVRRVQFKLHDSYSNPVRVYNKPPYEVTETGWGEFDITIKIIFTDNNAKPLIITHLLKLFHCDHEIMMGQKSLVREIYDEMIFVDPSPPFYRALLGASRGGSDSTRMPPARAPPPPAADAHPQHHETDFAEAKQHALANIGELNAKVTEAIVGYREQLKLKKDIVEEAQILVDDLESSMGSHN